MSETREPKESKRLLIGVETLLSVAGVCMVFVFPAYLWVVYFCLGTCRGPDGGQIRVFQVLVGLLALLVIATMVVAARRGARLAFAWHALVALLGVTSAIVFQVPVVDWADHFRHDAPPPTPTYVPCHSGSGDCPGG